MTYAEKLSDPKWQKRRLEIFSRDNWTCQHCNDTTTQLEIHHTEYFEGKAPWEYPDSSLITVCRNCHEKEGIRGKAEDYLIQSVKTNGFLTQDILSFSTMLFTHESFKNALLRQIRNYANS